MRVDLRRRGEEGRREGGREGEFLGGRGKERRGDRRERRDETHRLPPPTAPPFAPIPPPPAPEFNPQARSAIFPCHAPLTRTTPPVPRNCQS